MSMAGRKERGIVKKIAIFYCNRIKDHTCIACAKCFKGIRTKSGEFAKHDEEIEVVSMTDCGDCPGNILPRVAMIKGMLDGMDQEPDAIHLGTCIKMAYEHGNCPMDLDEVKMKLEAKFSKPVIIGTHDYV
jgi:predicted metal-binding protein